MNHWIIIILIVVGLSVVGSFFFSGQSLLWISLSFLRRLNQWTSGALGSSNRDWHYKFLVKVGNRYFLKGFVGTPYHQRLLFLPFCLCPPGCPAPVDPSMGMLCRSDCPDCPLGRVRREALGLGYAGVYVVPSSRCLRRPDLLPSDLFIKEKLDHHGARALLGVTCCWYLKTRLLTKYSFEKEGYVSEGSGTGYALQGILLPQRKCSQATVDWELVHERLRLKV
jgi:hypothetical protein